MQTVPFKSFDYERPTPLSIHQDTSSCQIGQAWAKVQPDLSHTEKIHYQTKITEMLQTQNAVMVAHYYVEPELQDLALATGGMVGDSLEMAKFGQNHPAQTLLIAGVKFMGETAKILSPEKTVLMPDLAATCSLDLGCPATDFGHFCDVHPDRTVVVYANTSAEVKARADWVVTSSIALEIVSYLHAKGEKMIWGPDRHLGTYIQQQTEADMLLWQGSCLVHNEFQGEELANMKRKYPNALVLVHPESPASVVKEADIVGSTSRLLNAAIHADNELFIVATDQGILHEMQKQAPNKTFLAAPTAGNGATCKSCAFCPWMAMNGLNNTYQSLQHHHHAIHLEPEVIAKAKQPITRMLNFAKQYQQHAKTQTSWQDNARYLANLQEFQP